MLHKQTRDPVRREQNLEDRLDRLSRCFGTAPNRLVRCCVHPNSPLKNSILPSFSVKRLAVKAVHGVSPSFSTGC